MAILDVTDDGNITAFGDCLLIMRYWLGYRGDDLIASAISSTAVRRTAPEIENYIAGIWNYLDVDGDGHVSFLDVWALFKYDAGFRGDDLLTDATNGGPSIAPGARRTTAAEIEAYIAKLAT